MTKKYVNAFDTSVSPKREFDAKAAHQELKPKRHQRRTPGTYEACRLCGATKENEQKSEVHQSPLIWENCSDDQCPIRRN